MVSMQAKLKKNFLSLDWKAEKPFAIFVQTICLRIQGSQKAEINSDFIFFSLFQIEMGRFFETIPSKFCCDPPVIKKPTVLYSNMLG